MRFVGPVHQWQIRGKPTPISELDWMLKRVDFLVQRRLEAEAFYGLEVTLIPVRDDHLLVADFQNRDRLYAREKVRISIPDKAQAPWLSPSGEEVKIMPVHRSGVGQGLYQILGGRLD